MAEEEQAEAKAEAVKVNGEIKVTLRKAIQANGEDVTELTFREPTAGDIERSGNPVIMDMVGLDRPQIVFDEKKMSAMMSNLAAVPPSAIRTLHPKDWNTIAWSLVNFFTPDM
jgi:hypothetical protein